MQGRVLQDLGSVVLSCLGQLRALVISTNRCAATMLTSITAGRRGSTPKLAEGSTTATPQAQRQRTSPPQISLRRANDVDRSGIAAAGAKVAQML